MSNNDQSMASTEEPSSSIATENDIDNNECDNNTLNERQKKLFQIRLKMNQARKANKKDVEEEFRSFSDPKYRPKYSTQTNNNINGGVGTDDSSNKNDDNDDISNKKKKESRKDWKEGKFDVMGITANDSSKWHEVKEKKKENQETMGWKALSSDASYKSYEKSLKKLNNKPVHSESANDNDITSLEQNLLSGSYAATKVSGFNLDKLSKHLEDKEKERMKYSRRRMHNDSSDVDYINDANAKFNKKIKKAYDPYTVEIRQNLERGTAI